MPNQQLLPQTSYPFQGDITSQPGQAQLTVTGLQTVPVSPAGPANGNVLTYVGLTGLWTPSGSVLNNASISVNGTPVSDDYFMSVNGNDTYVQVNSSFPPNGKPVLVNGA